MKNGKVARPCPPEDRDSKFGSMCATRKAGESLPACNTRGSTWPFPITQTVDWLRERVGCLLRKFSLAVPRP